MSLPHRKRGVPSHLLNCTHYWDSTPSFSPTLILLKLFLRDDDDGHRHRHRENGGELEIQTQELEDDEEALRQGGEEREHEGRNQEQESPQAHPANPQACRFPHHQDSSFLSSQLCIFSPITVSPTFK
ncbi:hypothetical protein V6N13_137632 [Hibiscus sabdariffa]|uniref:Uncharacterized protein n=1 Tax=Hibiscus sabdariffa TaxID=183260 RepID=A0ABR2DLM8_9ROSI